LSWNVVNRVRRRHAAGACYPAADACYMFLTDRERLGELAEGDTD